MNVKSQLKETLVCNIKKLKVTAECRLQRHCNSKEEWMLRDSSVL